MVVAGTECGSEAALELHGKSVRVKVSVAVRATNFFIIVSFIK